LWSPIKPLEWEAISIFWQLVKSGSCYVDDNLQLMSKLQLTMTSPSSSTKKKGELIINGINIEEKTIKNLPINKKSAIHSTHKQTEEPYPSNN